MQIQNHVRVLRSELFAMSRAGQRALDYSTKGYELANLAVCLHVQRDSAETHRLSCSIVERAQALLHSGQLPLEDQRFAAFALKLGHALQVTYIVATRIAKMTIHGLTQGRTVLSPETAAIGQEVNRSLRLCVVALFKGTIEDAKTALRIISREATFDPNVYQSFYMPASGATAMDPVELAIRKDLDRAAHQVFEMARAIVSWLETKRCVDASCQTVPQVTVPNSGVLSALFAEPAFAGFCKD
jgi:hypothetical protein